MRASVRRTTKPRRNCLRSLSTANCDGTRPSVGEPPGSLPANDGKWKPGCRAGYIRIRGAQPSSLEICMRGIPESCAPHCADGALSRVNVAIQNTGPRPATNFLVDIRASGNFGLTVPTSELRDYRLTPAMKRPNLPAQPKPPRSPKDILNELTRLDTLGLRYLDVTPHIQDQEDFEYTATPTIEPAPTISLRCGLWRH